MSDHAEPTAGDVLELSGVAEAETVRVCRDLLRMDTSNFGDNTGPGERKAAEYVAALKTARRRARQHRSRQPFKLRSKRPSVPIKTRGASQE